MERHNKTIEENISFQNQTISFQNGTMLHIVPRHIWQNIAALCVGVCACVCVCVCLFLAMCACVCGCFVHRVLSVMSVECEMSLSVVMLFVNVFVHALGYVVC